MHYSLGKIAKTFYIIGIIVAVFIGSSLASWLGHFPIVSIVNSATYRGGQIWEILLDEYTYPLAHANLYEYYKNEDSNRASLEKDKARSGFIRLITDDRY